LLNAAAGERNDYLERATRLWKHASKGGTQTASPHLLLSSLEMHRVTQQSPYFDFAQSSVTSLLSQQATNGIHHGAFGDMVS